jgi:hypothetical protein
VEKLKESGETQEKIITAGNRLEPNSLLDTSWYKIESSYNNALSCIIRLHFHPCSEEYSGNDASHINQLSIVHHKVFVTMAKSLEVKIKIICCDRKEFNESFLLQGERYRIM